MLTVRRKLGFAAFVALGLLIGGALTVAQWAPAQAAVDTFIWFDGG
jgi:hypothetical protein